MATSGLDAKAQWKSAVINLVSGEMEENKLPLIKKNRDTVTEFTQVITALNRDYFYKRLKQRVTNKINFLHQIELNQSLLVDEWGRTTSFYVIIGPYKIMLYQPGTPTFFSSIDKNSDLVATHDSCQQNGPILGMGCGCFLADFVTHLSSNYQLKCTEMSLDSHNFHPSIYESSLEESLKIFADEDCNAHGRLIEMKNALMNISGVHEVKSENIERYFYAKDIEVYRVSMVDHRNSQSTLDYSDITANDFKKILHHRHQCSTYQQIDRHLQVASRISKSKIEFINSDIWQKMKEQILVKNGIFEIPEQARGEIRGKFNSIEESIRQRHSMSLQGKSSISEKGSKSDHCTVS